MIYVELSYDYQPLISGAFTGMKVINATAAFSVRDDRDLAQIYQRDPANPDVVAACNVYDAFP